MHAVARTLDLRIALSLSLIPRSNPCVDRTFHGFPPGYALVLDSPTAFQVTPMQIDTWHRELMPISGGKKAKPAKFVPGPLPRGSLAPPNAKHSGLLE